MALDKYAFSKIARGENPASGAQGGPRYDAREYLGGGRDSGMSEDFISLSRRIADESDARRAADRAPEGRKKAEGLDYLASTMKHMADNIMAASGQEEAAKTETPLDDVGSFLMGLPLGTVSAIPTGLSQAHEAITGRRATEMDENGYIPEKDLDLGQRLATGASGAINLVGPFYGGSRGMLRAGKNAALMGGSKVAGALGADDAAVKMAGRAIESSARSMAESESKGVLRTLAGEALEEGAEEFVQSPLDEIRDGTMDGGWLGRAAQAGAMGALGGGIMSGVGIAADRAFGKMAGADGPSPDRQREPVAPSTRTVLDQYAFDTVNGRMVKDAQDALDRSSREAGDLHGAASVKQVNTGKPRGVNDSDIGAGFFKSVWDNPDDGVSAKQVADWFSVDMGTMAEIMSSEDYGQRLADLHRANKERGVQKPVHMGRNPATEKGGSYDQWIDEIVPDSSWVDLSSLAMNFVKSDADGDTVVVSLDPSLKTLGFITERMVDAVRGDWNEKEQRYDRRSNLDFGEFSYIPRSLSKGEMANVLERATERLSDAPAYFTDDKGRTPETKRQMLDRWLGRMAKMPEWGDADFAGFLTDVRSDVSKAIGDGAMSVSGNGPFTADNVVSDLTRELVASPEAVFARAIDAQMDDVRRKIDDLGKSIDLGEFDLTDDPDERGYERRGGIQGGVQKLVQLFAEMNMIGRRLSTVSTANPLFRQDGMLVMIGQSQEFEKLADDLWEQAGKIAVGDRLTAFEAMLSNVIKQTDVAGEVLNNVSGIFDDVVRAKTTARFFSKYGHPAATGEEIRGLMEIFAEEHNSLLGPYEKARRTATQNMPIEDRNMGARPSLERDGEDGWFNIAVVRAFNEAFENAPVGKFLDISNSPTMKGHTIGSYFEQYVYEGRTDRTQFGGMDREFRSYVNMSVKSVNMREAQIVKGIESNVAQISKVLEQVKRDGLGPSNIVETEFAVTALRKLFDPSVANDLGLTSAQRVLTGRFGEELCSGDFDRANNAIEVMAFAGKYDSVYRDLIDARGLLEEGRGDAAERIRRRVRVRLSRLAASSNTDRYICSEISSRTSDIDALAKAETFSPLFDRLTSFDYSYEEKVMAMEDGGVSGGSHLLADALSTDSSAVGSSGLSSKSGQSRSAFEMAKRANSARNLEAWNAVKSSLIDQPGGQEAVEAIVDLMSDRWLEIGNDVIASAVYTNTTLSNAMKEKGVTPEEAMQITQMMETVVNGQLASFSSKYLSRAVGVISKDEFQSNMSLVLDIILNKDSSIRVVDYQTGTEDTINRERIIRAASGGRATDFNLTPQNLDYIFSAYPSLITAIPRASINPIVNPETGESGVGVANGDPLYASIVQRMNERRRIRVGKGDRGYLEGSRIEHDRNMRIAKSVCMNDVGFVSEVILRTPGITDDMSLPAIKRAVDRTVDDIVESILHDAASDSGEAAHAKTRMTRNSEFWKDMSNSTNRLFKAASNLADLSMLYKGNRVALAEEQTSLAYDACVNSAIMGIVNEEGGDGAALYGDLNAARSDSAARESAGAAMLSASSAEAFNQMSIDLYAIVAAAYPDVMSDTAADIDSVSSGSVVTKWVERIDSALADGSITADAHDAIISRINSDELSRRVSEVMQPRVDLDGILTVADFDEAGGATVDALYEKIGKINKRNYDDAQMDEVRESIEDIFSGLASDSNERIEEAKEDMSAMIRLWNSLVVKEHIGQIRFRSAIDLNPYMLETMFESFDAIDRMTDSVRRELRSSGRPLGGSDVANDGYVRPKMPPADFSDPVLAFMTGRSLVNNTRGNAALDVGLNGSGVREREGLGLLPRNIRSEVPPVELTYADIVSAIASDNKFDLQAGGMGDPASVPVERLGEIGWNRFIEAHTCIGQYGPASDGKVPYKIGRVTRGTLERLRSDPSSTISVFDPALSPNGMDVEGTYGSMRPGDRRSLRILMEMGVLGDASQEGMALRSSKELGSKTEIAKKVETRDNIANPTASRVKDPSDVKGSMATVRAALLGFRDDYRDYLNELFKRPENKAMGFGEMQAMTYSRFLTPYVELRFGADALTLSAHDVLVASDESAARVSAALAAAAESGEEVLVVPRVVSPEFMESRIGAAEMRQFEVAGKTPDKVQAGIAARAAVEDWSDFRPHSLDVDDLMSGVQPISSSAFPVVREEDMQSSLNRFLDAARGIDGEETGWDFRKRDVPRVSEPMPDEVDMLKGMAERAGMSIRTADADGRISSVPFDGFPVMAFGTGRNKFSPEGVNDASMTFRSIDYSQNSENENRVRLNGDTYGILFDGGSVAKAIEWAVRYRQPLLVEDSVLDSHGGAFADCIVNMATEVVIGDGPSTRRFRVSFPYESGLMNTIAVGSSQSQARHVDPDSIAVIAFDPTRQSADSSGQVNRETMSSMGNRFMDVIDYPVGKIGGGLPGGALCDIDDIRELGRIARDGRIEDVLLIRDLGMEDISREAVVSSVENFVSAAVSGGFDYRSSASRFQTVAMIKFANASGQARYAPIVIPGNAPRHLENIKPSVGQNGDVSIYGFYDLMAASDETIKMALASQAHKTQTVAVDPSEMSRFNVTVDGRELRADLNLNDQTASGRRPGNVDRPHMFNAYMGSVKWGGSLFFERDAKGVWRWRDRFLDWSKADRDMLLDGKSAVWGRIADGDLVISDDPDLNSIVQNIAYNCKRYDVNPAILLSSVSKDSVGGSSTVLRGVVQNFISVATGMNKPQVLKLFHAMNPKLCPDWDFKSGTASYARDANGEEIPTVFDENFNMSVVIERSDGTLATMPINVSLEIPRDLGHSSFTDRQGGSAKNSKQRQQRAGMDRALTGSEVKTILEDMAIRRGDVRALEVMGDERRAERLEGSASGDGAVDGFTRLTDEDVDAYLGDRLLNSPSGYTSYADIKRINDVRSVAETFTREVEIIGFDGEPVPSPDRTGLRDDYTEARSKVNRCRDRMSRALGGTIDYDHFIWLLLYDGGTTYNGGVGDFSLSLDAIERGTDRVVASLESGCGLPITIDENAVSLDDRYCVPLLSPEMAAYMYRFPAISENQSNRSITDFKRRMADEARKAKDQVDNIIANGTTRARRSMAEAKRHSLYKFLDWAFLENGLNEVSGHIHGNVYMSDLLSNDTNFWDGIIGFADLGIDRDELKAELERTASKMADYARIRQEKLNYYENGAYKMTDLEKGEIDKIEKILDYMTRVQQSLAVLSPSVMAGNVVSKGIMTNLSSLALRAGRDIGLGAYASGVDVDQGAVKQFSHSDRVQKAFLAYRMAMIDGDVASLIAAVDNEASLDQWIENKKRTGIFNRINDGIFNLVNGENLFLSRQIENFINYFLILESDSGHNFWFASADRGDGSPHARTIVEEMMTGDGSQKLIIDILLGRNNNVSLDNAQVAMNWAMQGDMAQRNVVSMFYQKAIRKYGNSVKFLTTSFMSKFFQYRTNQIGHTLQYVAPMSSINYLFTKYAAERNARISRESGGEVLNEHYEDAQVFTSLKRAVVNDLVHLGPAAVALVLASIPGLLEPPEDDKKAGNYDEWLVMGLRVRADWELQDLLGLTMPLACFFKSVLDGKPRLDILANGIGDAMFGSPIAKVGDIVNLLGDGDGSFWSEYEQDVEAYADAKGGSPSVAQWLAGKGKAFALTFLGQFVTPAFIKEFMDERYEHSYKRVWEEGTSGRETEDGQQGRTMRTDFEDAQIRRVTRSNPVLGLLMNFVSGRDDYIEGNMPLVEIYDPIALDSMRRWSVNDENGDPLPREVQEEKIIEIISVLQSTDDMEALYSAGFFLDYDTRKAVGDTIWDVVTEMGIQFDKLKEDGGLNWEMLGEGDTYGLGQQRAQAIYNAYKEERSYWESLYYDKLQSEPMRRSLPVYNRIKTDYSRDSDGEFYASGFLTGTGALSSLSPIQVAPGTRWDPEGTMGYEGDWATPSVINGQSTGERGLVPMPVEVLPIVQFEEHSADGAGNGFSKRYTGGPNDQVGSDKPGKAPSGRRPRGYRRGGGGGGGGRGYSPNLYSRLPRTYNPSPKTMYGERLYDTKYDYLRPGFETKGSREAYKRSDF